MQKQNIKFEILLQHISNSQNSISEKNRSKIMNLIANMDSNEALILYKDLCYLYICACNDEHPDKSKIEKLTFNYSSSFIKSLVDIGDLMEKLADASYLDQTSRKDKWLEEQKQLEIETLSHKANANIMKSWSSFSLSSRIENEKAYMFLRSQKSQINLNETWGEIIMLSIPELQTKPPHFFNTIYTRNLSLLQKRALIHKLKTIQNIIPKSTRNMINELDVQIFNECYQENVDQRSSSCRICSCCTIM